MNESFNFALIAAKLKQEFPSLTLQELAEKFNFELSKRKFQPDLHSKEQFYLGVSRWEAYISVSSVSHPAETPALAEVNELPTTPQKRTRGRKKK